MDREAWTAIIALILGSGSLSTLIAWLLGRKGANKKLEIDEGTLTVEQFNAALPAYRDLLDRSNNDRSEALKELKAYKSERVELLERVKKLEESDEEKSEELDKTSTKLESLRALFQKYVARVGVPLTTEEVAVFEDTAIMPRRRRPRTHTS